MQGKWREQIGERVHAAIHPTESEVENRLSEMADAVIGASASGKMPSLTIIL
jgi:hypothetical protein